MEERDGAQDALADQGVHVHLLPFAQVQGLALSQDRLVHRDLPDVVHQAGAVDHVQLGRRKTQLLSDRLGIGRDAHRVSLGVRILRLDRHRQGDDHAHEQVLELDAMAVFENRDPRKRGQHLQPRRLLRAEAERRGVVQEDRAQVLPVRLDRRDGAPGHVLGVKELARPRGALFPVEEGDGVEQEERLHQLGARSRENEARPLGQGPVGVAEEAFAGPLAGQDRDAVRAEEPPRAFRDLVERDRVLMERDQRACDLVHALEKREGAGEAGRDGGDMRRACGKSALGRHVMGASVPAGEMFSFGGLSQRGKEARQEGYEVAEEVGDEGDAECNEDDSRDHLDRAE